MKMTYPQATVIAAAVVAGALVLSGMARTQPAESGAPAAVRFQIAATPGQSVANAWRLDLHTGEVYRCFATGGVYGAVCRRARFQEAGPGRPGGPGMPEPDSTALPAAFGRAR